MSPDSSAAVVQEQMDTVQHALSMIGGTGWIARSQAEIALGRLAAWAERGVYEAHKEATTHVSER